MNLLGDVKMKEQTKGLFYAFYSAIFNSTFAVSTKYLLQSVSQSALMPLWFIIASVMSFFVGLKSDKKELFASLKKHWKAGLIIGITNMAAAFFFFTSVRVIGPAPSAFLAKFDIIFILILGFLFFRERLNLNELIGVLIAIIGGFIFAFSSAHLTLNAYLGILAAIAIGLNTLFARLFIQNISVWVLQIYRTTITAAGFLLLALILGDFAIPELHILILIALGTLLSAVIGLGFYYSALRHIKASIAAIIRNLEPFLVVIYAYPLFRTFPSLMEWIGGIIIVTGVTITILAMNNNHKKIYKKTKFSVSQHG